jgi:uncharacterized tellurite resistance protein B-like protein
MILDMKDLTPEEDLALMGLLKAVIQADHQMSFEERRELSAVAAGLGAQRFRERVDEAKRIFHALADIKTYAKKIERQPARQLIFNLVRDMAERDEVIHEEEDLLAWLAETWSVEYFRK